ncbi:MAG: hypothetical protein ACRD01_04545 [Terriglobales bacterium]
MPSDARQHAHDLIDRMAPVQVAAVANLLEAMHDPVARALAEAPIDDEPVSAEEDRPSRASRAHLAWPAGFRRARRCRLQRCRLVATARAGVATVAGAASSWYMRA